MDTNFINIINQYYEGKCFLTQTEFKSLVIV